MTDAVVYGVSVAGHEGRAGMAAIVTDGSFALAGLWEHLAARLPRYAQPLFLRIAGALDVTGTFKPVKRRLQQEGYAAATDPVWFNDREAEPLHPLRFRTIAVDRRRHKAALSAVHPVRPWHRHPPSSPCL